MKRMKKVLAAAAVLCLLMALLPCASAEIDERFEGKSWEVVTGEMLTRIGAYDMGTFGIGYYNTVTGEEHFINPDEYIAVGSVYKVPLNMLYCERIANGEMTLETQVFGIPYDILLRGTIIDSNNDFAKTLWDNIGSYHHYRELICPYMGEEAETVNSKFYENNFFTARQMITCLRTLYENPDRFPYIIDTMLVAEPNAYFHRDEHRFLIAHKYGYNAEMYHTYVADSGIIYTTDPFLLVVFTDNTPSSLELLAQYTVLMCDYTEYNTAKRLKADAADRAVETLSFPAAPEAVSGGVVNSSSEAPVLSMDLMDFVKLIGVVAAVLVLLGLCAKMARHTGYAIVVPAVIVLAAGLLICRALLNSGGASIFAGVKGDGSETTELFFSELEEGAYDEAVAQLNGYAALGVETTPEDPYAARIYEALRRSYGHLQTGGTVIDKAATRSVLFTHLKLSQLQTALREETKAVLNSYEAERAEETLYDEGFVFKPEVVQEAYAQAFEAVMGRVDSCFVQEELNVALSYNIKGWQIEPDAALLNAICGK